MKQDLDQLMEKREMQALIVIGEGHDNVIRSYMTNGAHVTGGTVVKKRGEPAVMIVGGMEIEEAAKSGLQVYSVFDLGYAELLKEVEGDGAKAAALFFGRVLEHFNVPAGKIGVYGHGEIHRDFEMIKRVSAANPQYQFVGEDGTTIFDEAFQTKDAQELLRIRSVAARTSEVLALTWEYIASHRADGDQVVDADGKALTIGMVKRFVRRALLDHDLEDTDMIFAQGHDAGVPHSRGEADMSLKTGEAIVFDLFPREIGGGYHHDCTRTWSISYAKPEVEAAYDLVMNAYEIAVDNFRPNMPAKLMQEAVQDYFESHGHATGRSKPGTSVGYVHGLGHGLGLEIHESPRLSHLSKDTLRAGNVISIEPGLYYPDAGYGVRIEDTLMITDSGELISLTDFHKNLVVPLRG